MWSHEKHGLLLIMIGTVFWQRICFFLRYPSNRYGLSSELYHTSIGFTISRVAGSQKVNGDASIHLFASLHSIRRASTVEAKIPSTPRGMGESGKGETT